MKKLLNEKEFVQSQAQEANELLKLFEGRLILAGKAFSLDQKSADGEWTKFRGILNSLTTWVLHLHGEMKRICLVPVEIQIQNRNENAQILQSYVSKLENLYVELKASCIVVFGMPIDQIANLIDRLEVKCLPHLYQFNNIPCNRIENSCIRRDDVLSHCTNKSIITGPLGMGKSQLSLQYSIIHALDYNNRIRLMNGENKEMLDHSYYDLAKDMNLFIGDMKEVTNKEIVQRVKVFLQYLLEKKLKCLLLFVNVIVPNVIVGLLNQPVI